LAHTRNALSTDAKPANVFRRLFRYQRQILVPRPMYKYMIEGLRPDTDYEVLVEAKHSKVKAKPGILR